MSAWLEALRAMRIRLVAAVWAGTLLLALLGMFWLQIPDSHLWEFAFSILFACGLVALFFWFYSWVFKSMLKPAEVERWWLRWILLAAVLVVWWLLQMPIDRLVEHRELYAGVLDVTASAFAALASDLRASAGAAKLDIFFVEVDRSGTVVAGGGCRCRQPAPPRSGTHLRRVVALVVLGGGSCMWMDSVCRKRQVDGLDSRPWADRRGVEPDLSIGICVYPGCAVGLLCARSDRSCAASY